MVRHIGAKGESREVMFTLADLAALEAALKVHPDCKLVVVDPIGSFLGGGTDAHRDNDVRGEPPAISWEREPVAMNADDALAAENGNGRKKPGPEPVARNQAAEWLRDLLHSGPMLVAKIKDEAKEAGYAWRTLHRAKDDLGIKPYREHFGGAWMWKLPLRPESQDTACHDP